MEKIGASAPPSSPPPAPSTPPPAAQAPAARAGAPSQAQGPSPAAQQVQKDGFSDSRSPAASGQRDQGDTFQAAAPSGFQRPTLDGQRRGQEAIVQQAREASERRARERATDGQFVGPNGVSPNRETAGAFQPADGRLVSDRPIFFVNGINTTAEEQAQAAQALADRTRRPVHAIHNATSGAVSDVGQSVRQKLFGAETPSSRTLSNEIINALGRGETIDVYGHSQGAIDVSNAINAASRHLFSQGLTRDQVQQRLGAITAHTFGGAAQMFADGPRYTHHINSRDPVAGNFGLGGIPNGMQRPGRGAVINRQNQPGDSHAFMSYLNWAIPQAQVN